MGKESKRVSVSGVQSLPGQGGEVPGERKDRSKCGQTGRGQSLLTAHRSSWDIDH